MLNTFKLLYGFQPVSYISNKSYEEIKMIFQDSIKPVSHQAFFKRPIKGYLKDSKIFLYRQPSSMFTSLIWPVGKTDYYYPIFKGTLVSKDGKTIIDGKFSINLGSKIFLSAIYIFLLFAFLVLNISTYEKYVELDPPLMILSIEWLVGFFVISIIVYFFNYSIKKATLPNREVYSALSDFIEECIK